MVRGDFGTQNRVKLGKPSQPLQTLPRLGFFKVGNGPDPHPPPPPYKNHFSTSKLGKTGKIQDALPPMLGWFPKFYLVLISEVSPNNYWSFLCFFKRLICQNIYLKNLGGNS